MLENNINTPSPPFLLNSPSPTPNLQETRVGLKFKGLLQQRAIVNPVLQSEELGWDLSFTKVSEPKFAHKNLVHIIECTSHFVNQKIGILPLVLRNLFFLFFFLSAFQIDRFIALLPFRFARQFSFLPCVRIIRPLSKRQEEGFNFKPWTRVQSPLEDCWRVQKGKIWLTLSAVDNWEKKKRTKV